MTDNALGGFSIFERSDENEDASEVMETRMRAKQWKRGCEQSNENEDASEAMKTRMRAKNSVDRSMDHPKDF